MYDELEREDVPETTMIALRDAFRLAGYVFACFMAFVLFVLACWVVL